MRTPPQGVTRYLLAVLIMAAAGMLRLIFAGSFSAQYPLITFYPAVVLIAWRSGFGPGLLAGAIGAGLAYYSIAGGGRLRSADALAVASFAVFSLIVSWLSDRTIRSVQRLEQERRLSDLTLSSIGDAVVTTDKGNLVRFLNAAASALTGWPAEEARGKPVGDILQFESNYLRDRLGRKIPVEHTEAPIQDGGAPEGTVYVFRDITSRIEAEQRLTQLMSSNVIGILFGDIYGAIHEANDEFLRIIGRSREELRKREVDWKAITPPEHLAADERGIQEAIQKGACTPYEKEYIRQDGSRVPVLIGYVLLAPARERSVVFIVDLSSRRAYEQALARMNEDLQHFTYGAGHDLKEPLRMVSTYTQLLSRKYRGQLDSDADDYLEFIVAGVKRMRSLVDALLEYSRAGQVPTAATEPASADLAVADALVALRASIDEAQAEIDCDPLPVVTAEPMHLSQIFQNLIGNAIKYRGDEAPKIFITASVDNDWCTFCVSDNGEGISPEHQEVIFGPFTRLHGHDIAGTGLGLATTRRIVERYGGRIWVESEGAGKGSAFRFTLKRYTSGA